MNASLLALEEVSVLFVRHWDSMLSADISLGDIVEWWDGVGKSISLLTWGRKYSVILHGLTEYLQAQLSECYVP